MQHEVKLAASTVALSFWVKDTMSETGVEFQERQGPHSLAGVRPLKDAAIQAAALMLQNNSQVPI